MAFGIEARGPAGARSVLLAVGASLAVGGIAHAEAADGAADGSDRNALVVTAQRNQPLNSDTGLATAPGTLQDLPQAVTVVTPEQLKTQNVTTLQQALRNVPGITVAIGEGGTLNGDQFKLRGQDASNDIYLDGLRDFGVYARDSFDYQEVQVLKGPSGALFGRGAVGGAINVVTKQPQLSDSGSAQVQGGNGSFGRATVDLNKALSPTSAVRLDLMAQTTDAIDRDVVNGKRWGVALTGGIGLGTSTSLVASYMHQHDRHVPDYGVTITQPPGQLIALPATSYDVGVDRSTFLGYDTDVDRTDADIFTVRFTHLVTPDVTFTSDSRLGHYSRHFQYTTVDRCDGTAATFFCTNNLFDSDPNTVPNAFIGGGGPYRQDAWGAQNISTIRIEKPIGRFKNQFIGGFDISWQKNDKDFSVYALPAGVTARTLIPQNLLDPSHTPPAGYYAFHPNGSNLVCPATGACTTTAGGATVFTNATAATVLQSNGHSWDYGAFATDRFWLNDHWSLIGSLRYDRYDADYDTTTVVGQHAALSSGSNLFNPRASLVFEPDAHQTYYLSFGRSATPPGTSIVGSGTALAVTTKDLQPEVSSTWEAGAKYAAFKGRLALTASVFTIDKSNARQTDPATGDIQVQSGQKQRIRGVELGLNGAVTRRWKVYANYAYLDAEITDDLSCSTVAPIACAPSPDIGRQVTYTPKHATSLWTTYALDQVLPGLEAGGGLTYQSDVTLGYTLGGVAGAPNGITRISRAPETVSLDGYLAYETGRWRIAVNGYNLTDRLNYVQVFSNRAVPSPGRTVVLTLGASF